MLWSRALSACRARFRADLMFATVILPSYKGIDRDPERRSGAEQPRIIRGLRMIVNDLASKCLAGG